MNKILLIDDEADVQYSFRRIFNQPDLTIATAPGGDEGLRLLPKFNPDLVIMDVRMAGMSGLEALRRIRESDAKIPIIMMTAYGTTHTAIEAMKLGAFDYLLKPFDIPKLKQVVENALKASRDMKEVVNFASTPDTGDSELGIVGQSEPMQAVFKLIGQLASSDATVLITGESGTGKELVARAIYHHSQRNQQPFLAINCAAIPENLLESELFGHEKGAFTGATQLRVGKFEQCHRGTLFLDEIGDMPPATQAKILRVLQSGAFERVGGNQTFQADVRMIAATNRQLEETVAARSFREDLYYRLNVVRFRMPPLRERPEDIPMLAQYFLRKLQKSKTSARKSLSAEALQAMTEHAWPGNVRELENAIQRALVIATGEVILARDLFTGPLPALPATAQPSSPAPSPTSSPAVPDNMAEMEGIARSLFRWARKHPTLKVLPAVEKELVRHALKETRGNQVQAAKILGITRATLRKRVAKFHLEDPTPSDHSASS
ncbi:MAG: sigma-54-dependent Fis family transcriptional regulator [Verrucomicrobia bacterium]|nr:sigma-54-dependent Fis family transcriptional regulator [Verrucomicrobiota bacterium]